MQEGTLLRLLIRALQAGAQIANELLLQTGIACLGNVVMPQVEEGIPLVMPSAVRSHPWGDRLSSAIFNRLREVDRIVGGVIQLHRTQFHVIYPVILLIDVGRLDGGRLANARFAHTRFVSGSGFPTNLSCEVGIKIFQYPCA